MNQAIISPNSVSGQQRSNNWNKADGACNAVPLTQFISCTLGDDQYGGATIVSTDRPHLLCVRNGGDADH